MMDYSDIIKDNYDNHSPVKWWTKFAYHCTDVANASSILKTGFLYSRANATQLGLMSNDNASRQVIDMTQTEALSCVRFYFRPLTPTQYYNEGFKHPQLRYCGDDNANMPVPVFFLFDLDKLLAMPGVQFSELPQSGHGAVLKSGSEAFAALPFDKIYSTGSANIADLKTYRHAEILHPSSLPIDSCLSVILCRNDLERLTLLNLIREKDYKAFCKYKNLVKVCKESMFENNGLYLQECRYHENVISIIFSDAQPKQQYIITMMKRNEVESLKPVSVRISLDWVNSRGTVKHSTTETQIPYDTIRRLTVKSIPTVTAAKTLQIRVHIEEKLMCFIEQSVEEAELIK